MVSSELTDSVMQALHVLSAGKNTVRLLGGLAVTIRIAAVSVACSLFAGTCFGLLMTVKNRGIRVVCRIYLECMRIIPQLVLLFLCYFGASRAFGIQISGEASALFVFTLWGTAEMGDLVRGAVSSIPKQQYESARAIGLTEYQIQRWIIIPQTVRRLVPVSMNLITRMIKTTPLVVFVGVVEVVKVGQQIIEASRLTVPSASIAVYAVIFLLYFFVCWPVSLLAAWIEKRRVTQEG